MKFNIITSAAAALLIAGAGAASAQAPELAPPSSTTDRVGETAGTVQDGARKTDDMKDKWKKPDAGASTTTTAETPSATASTRVDTRTRPSTDTGTTTNDQASTPPGAR